MPKLYTLNSQAIAWWLLGGVAAVDALAVVTHLAPMWPLQVVLFVGLSFIPGLAILRLFGARFKALLGNIVASFALSVLTLMVSSLIANQLLPTLGIVRPLEFAGVFGAWNIIVITLIVAADCFNRTSVRLHPVPKLSWRTGALVSATVLVPVLATLGAFRLNNGGDGALAVATLVVAAALIVWVFIRRERMSDPAVAWFIFTLGLAVLLMTSLRSWDITGHDIAREFRVYSLTHAAARWDVGSFRDAYNACLSITILPQAYTVLLHTSGLVVFKVVLQVIFAVCPVVVYLLLRHHLSKLGALVGCMFFISYPTFINDAAMLTRQGVAYLFFALALFAVLDRRQSKAHKLLFLLCSLGVILSHYSTSYMFVTLFAVAVVIKFVAQHALAKRAGVTIPSRTVMAPVFAVILAAATFTWSGLITQTGGGLGATIKMSLANIPRMMSDDNKSSDTSSALFFAAKKSQIDVYQSYVTDPKLTTKIPATRYMPQLSEDTIPLTPLGQWLHHQGIETTLLDTWRQATAQLLQVLALGGVIYITFVLVRKRPKALSLDYVCMCWGGLVLLGLIVVLPTFSLNYGILRAFHQSMIFLLLPVMLLLAWAGRHLRPRLRTGVAGAGMVGLFLLFTGVFAQTLGGVSATLSLNNRGLYHGLYYTTQADLHSFAWMKAHIAKGSDVRASSFAQALMHDSGYPFSNLGILPSQVHNGTYVYLNEAQTLRQKLYVNYDGNQFITTFPLSYYTGQTNKIYSTAGTGVYH